MEQKGLVGHRRRGKTYAYFAKAERDDTFRTMAGGFLDRVFDGAVDEYLVHALQSRHRRGRTGAAGEDDRRGQVSREKTCKRGVPMNASLAGFAVSLAAWLGDFYLLATLLLGTVFLGFRWVRQPVRRLSVAWIATIELAVLAVVHCRAGRGTSLVAATPGPTASPLPRPGGDVADKAGMTDEPVPAAGNSREPSGPATAEIPLSPAPGRLSAFPSFPILFAFVFLAGTGLTGLWLCCGAATACGSCDGPRRRRRPQARAGRGCRRRTRRPGCC